MKLPIYLDYMATTPVSKRVATKMFEYLTIDGTFGNPASNTHIYGLNAREAVEKARAQVANAIKASANEIIWTSGATEANNLALKGAAEFYRRRGQHIITCQTEHKSILGICKYLETQGFSITYLPVKQNGLIDLQTLSDSIRDDTVLVSIMYVNNEIGVIQNIPEIANIVKPRGILLHVDAAQAIGKITIDVQKIPIDMLSMSAHKVYGPKGIGALFLRQKPRLHLTPQIHGGDQEFGLRSGTLATHQIVGMGEAFEIAGTEFQTNIRHIEFLHKRLLDGIGKLNTVHIFGDLKQRVPHNLNISFENIKSIDLLSKLKDLALSIGAACDSAHNEPSHVLKALGISNELALGTIRISIGNYTTANEIDFVIEKLNAKSL